MCGLIAGTGTLETKRLVALGCLSEDRGSDSAGVGWATDEPKFLKIAQNPLVAYPITLYPAIRSAVKRNVPIIGHTRQATTGAVTSDNAHPFLDDGILFAHNGMIFNHGEFGTYEVDSQSLIHGIKAKDFSKYQGPIGLVWIESGQLHAFRKGNPLYRGVHGKGIYLASEEKFLKEIECEKIKSLAEGRIYKWKGPALESAQNVPTQKEYAYKKYTPHSPIAYPGFGEDSYVSWADRRYRDNAKETHLIPIRKEADTLAEADGETGRDIPTIGTLCVECRCSARMVASDYCFSCKITFA